MGNFRRSGVLAVARSLSLSLSLSLSTGAAAREVRVDPSFDERELGASLELAYDPGGKLGIDEVIGGALPWTPSTKRVPALGYRAGVEWARVTLDDARAESDEPLVLEHGYGQTDRIEVFEVEGREVVARGLAGDQVPLRAWSAIVARFPAFELQHRRGARVAYLRVSGESSHQFPTTLFTRSAYEDHRRRDLMAQSVFYGALLMMAAYNALLAAATRSRLYGFYVAYILSYLCLAMTLGGLLPFIVGPRLVWINHAVAWCTVAVGLTSLVFAQHLLALDRSEPWGWFVHALRWPVLASAFGPLAFGYSRGLYVIFGLALIWAATLLGAAGHGVRQGNRAAGYFLGAWSLFIVGTAMLALRAAGVVPTNIFTTNASQLGAALELLVLSFALADRIKTLEAKALAAANEAAAANERALLEERRLGKARDEFVANTSHELRTPLNGMLGLVSAVLLRDASRLSAASKQSLDGVVKSGQRLAALVGDLLDFSRGQRDALQLRRAPTSVHRQAGLVLELVAPIIGDRHLELVNDVPAQLEAVDADPHRLQQVLLNLVGNALKFTPSGSITVSAKASGALVTVRVSDTGPGIAESAQARIFEAFTQADGTIERRFGGTGLGLAITKQLVEAHGGTMGVLSTPGFGASFWFTLPVASEAAPTEDDGVLASVIGDKAEMLRMQLAAGGAARQQGAVEGSPAVPLAASTGSEQPGGGALDVLVIDDEPVNRQVLVELLALAGHRVRAVGDGDAGLVAAREALPGVVLLDVMMPGKSGYDVLSELRASYNEAELPVLLLTAKAQERDLVEGFRRGASDYILKPFSASEVHARVQHQARLRDAIRATELAEREGEKLRVTLAQAEDQLLHAERLASLGAATAGIAHDLTNPLHHVRTSFAWIDERAERLEPTIGAHPGARPDFDALRKFARLGATSGASALAIAEAVRKASRTDDGAALEVVGLDEVVRDVLVILRSKLLPVEVEHVEDGRAVLRGRRSEVLQVAMNLIGNAADALAEREEPRRIRISSVLAGDGCVLVVEDSGPGIPERLRRRIFEPFFTTKPSGKGTGLGLATVATIAKRWGARVDVRTSGALGGALFELELPRHQP